MRIRLSDHFDYARLIRYSLPAISMMIFTSIYGVVDGFFVSNYCGKIPFTALNLIYPLIMIISTIGYMFSAGGSAVVAITLGQGDKRRANRYFSMFVYVAIVSGIFLSSLGQIFLSPIAELLGARGEVLDQSLIYAHITLLSTPALVLQIMFQTFFNTSEKPKLGLYITILSGCTNMVLDFVLVGMLKQGISGAAWATVFSEYVGGILPLIYFARRNDSLLRLVKTRIEWGVLVRAMWNGVSEFFSNISASIISILYNLQLLKYAGENGVSAFGVLMYVYFVFAAVTIGYTMATSPIIGYHFGAENTAELKNLFRRSIVIMAVSGLTMFIAAETLAGVIADVFVSYDQQLYELTKHAFRFSSLSYLIVWFNVFGSALFTALGNGTVSAVLSVSRTFVIEAILILTLPGIFGIEGVWYAFVLTEVAGAVLTAVFIVGERHKYNYY